MDGIWTPPSMPCRSFVLPLSAFILPLVQPSSASRRDLNDIARPYNPLLKRVHFLFSMKMPVSIKSGLLTDHAPQPQHPTVVVPSRTRFPSHTHAYVPPACTSLPALHPPLPASPTLNAAG